MENVYAYLAGAAAVIVGSELLLTLLPEGSMRGYVKVVLGIAAACMLAAPLLPAG